MVQDLILQYEIEEKARDRTADRIAAIERKLSRLKELYINDLIDLDAYKADRAALMAEIEDLQGKATEGRTKAADNLRGLLSPDLWTLYADFTKEEKRRFWRGIIKKIEFGKDRSINVIFL